MGDKVQYVVVKPEDSGFEKLCRMLDGELDRLAGGAEERLKYAPYNKRECLYTVVMAYDGDIPVGCGALKVFGGETAELKRFFVKPEYRRQGIGQTILAYLEEEARKAHFQKLILETGAPLEAAVALYHTAGFTVMENYGPYRDMPESLCMQKVI